MPEKAEKSKFDKITNYLPWRTGLTVAAFAINPIVGMISGALLYGNYRKTEHKDKENTKPGFIKRWLIRGATVGVGFMIGGPIGAAITASFVFADIISGGRLIQGAEKLLDVSYNVLSQLGDKALNGGKLVVNKIRGHGVESRQQDIPQESIEQNKTGDLDQSKTHNPVENKKHDNEINMNQTQDTGTEKNKSELSSPGKIKRSNSMSNISDPNLQERANESIKPLTRHPTTNHEENKEIVGPKTAELEKKRSNEVSSRFR